MARPTLVSLARQLGVSRQTVSNVINAPHLVKPETRERVQAAIDASGYQPNRAAQALRRQRSQTIAMRIYPSSDGIYGAVMDRFLHRLVRDALTHGYYVMPITAQDDDQELERLTSLFGRGSIDACLLSGTSAVDRRPTELSRRGLPFATFGRPWHLPGGEADHHWVDVDGADAMRRATTALWGKGFRRIGHIGFEPGSGPGDDRRAGWLSAIRELCGEPGCQQWQTKGADTVEAGVRGMRRLHAMGVDAVVCSSDSLAFGASEFLRREAGIEPSASPVIGFDDSPVARALGLSSVAQPVDMAVSLLIHALMEELRVADDGGEPEPQGVLLKATLMPRGMLAD